MTMQPTKELSPDELADILEAGKYRKTIGALHDRRGYCCLGVYAVECGIMEEDGEAVEAVPSVGCPDGFLSATTLGPLAPDWMQVRFDEDRAGDNVEQHLINLNDNDTTSWEPVIDFLRSLKTEHTA